MVGAVLGDGEVTDAERIADLQEQVAHLRRELGIACRENERETLRRYWRLTPMESHIIAMLNSAAGRYVGKGSIAEMLEEVGSKAEFEDANIKVMVCRIRLKCGPGLIETAHGMGYRLSAVGRARVYQALNPNKAAAA